MLTTFVSSLPAGKFSSKFRSLVRVTLAASFTGVIAVSVYFVYVTLSVSLGAMEADCMTSYLYKSKVSLVSDTLGRGGWDTGGVALKIQPAAVFMP